MKQISIFSEAFALRDISLNELGDPLLELDRIIDWQVFVPHLYRKFAPYQLKKQCWT